MDFLMIQWKWKHPLEKGYLPIQWYDDYGDLQFLLNLNCQQENVKYIIKGKMPHLSRSRYSRGFVFTVKSTQYSFDMKERY